MVIDAIKDIIVFFVESAIMLIPAITDAILALARGDIAGVAKAMEFGLAKLISLVIGLFARLIGLNGLSKRVGKIFKKIRKRIDKAISKLLRKARKAARKLFRKKKKKKGGKDQTKEDPRTEKEKKTDLQNAKKKAQQLLEDPDKSPKEVKKGLPKIKKDYDLTKINLVDKGDGIYFVSLKVNPEDKTTDEEKSLPAEGKVYLVYHEKYGRLENPHYQVVLSNGNIYDLTLDENDKIEIRVFSLLSKDKNKSDVKVKGTSFKEVRIDQSKADKINPFNKYGNKMSGKDAPKKNDLKDYKKLKSKFEASEYKEHKLDCFNFSVDFINKVVNLKNTQVVTVGNTHYDSFDSIKES